jgi:membrane carboxypeptidase/penicillin-binding protein
MRVFFKICITFASATAILLVAALAWLRYDTRGLPNVEPLRQYLQANATPVIDSCLGPITAVTSYESIGSNMRAALSSAEVSEDSPGVLVTAYRDFMRPAGANHVSISLVISRTLVCTNSRPLVHSIDELRTAVQLERRFTSRELFTIFANRLVFANDVIGVESASQYFFRKHSSELSIDEAALLVGMLKSPTRYSPYQHPDRAVLHRNQVIDEMLQQRQISESEAFNAKSALLHIAGR